VFNPLYSDIAADKRAHAEGPEPVATSRQTTPGELVGIKPSGPVYGDTQVPSKQPLPSAGEIAEEQTTHPAGAGSGARQGAWPGDVASRSGREADGARDESWNDPFAGICKNHNLAFCQNITSNLLV
jgi:hypothetical protein